MTFPESYSHDITRNPMDQEVDRSSQNKLTKRVREETTGGRLRGRGGRADCFVKSRYGRGEIHAEGTDNFCLLTWR